MSMLNGKQPASESSTQRWTWPWILESLNSPLGIFILSSILVSCLTYAYNQWQRASEIEQEKRKLIFEMEAELKYRLLTFREELEFVRETLQQRQKNKGSQVSASDLIKKVGSLYQEMESPPFAAFPENKSRGIYSLLIQLDQADSNSSRGGESHGKAIKLGLKASHAMHRIYLRLDGLGSAQQLEECLDSLLELLNGEALRRWCNPDTWSYADAALL